ncbi:BOLA class I histocompatibility antigen, alpha chain BL3-7-like isoform X2 [Notamacropus eugenii]|uniref:BOLA class I histocompatibility antigen, alpha chain BL3-7-like isoform X2 n=1 Tax=Notamacropus eugenii TaxID=9315 RepID=UPI003B674881
MERHVSSLFLLWTLTLTETWADSHSLRYLSTSVTRPELGEPRFFSVGYVDDRQFARFDSDVSSAREESRAPWMELVDKVDPEYWERNTRFHKEAAQKFLARLEILSAYYNDTKEGVHIFQHLCGCEVYQNLTFKRGFFQFAYDGRDFLSLDTETYKWTASVPRALITKLGMEADESFKNDRKAYLEDTCVKWLRMYLDIGKEDLKIEPPSARVTHHTAPNGEVTLKCWTQDFYPKEISLTWLRDGEEQLQDMEFIETRPAGDGTFQKWAVVQMTSGQEGKYTCQVQHEGLSEPLTLKWEPPSPSTWLTVGVIATVLLITLIAGVRIWRKKTSGRDSTQRSVPL